MEVQQPLPRVLDIRTFVEARAPELSALLNGIQTVHGAGKFGAAALPRHLRRRATSHRRRVHVRRKNMQLAALPKRRKLTHGPASSQVPGPSDKTRPTNRRMRRRPGLLSEQAQLALCEHLTLPTPASAGTGQATPNATQQQPNSSNAQGTSTPGESSSQSPSIRHLETHAWHARRMSMHTPLWGHSLAMHTPGKGHGSRSFLHHVTARCVMHDASYTGCLQLSGHQAHITKMLELCSDAAHLAEQMSRAEVVCGAVEWCLDLHQCGAYPAALLAPVRLMWIPCDTRDADAVLTDQQQVSQEGWYDQCLCWMWVHPAAFKDCAAALQQAMTQLKPTGHSVQLVNLSSYLRRIEVVGSTADAAVHQAVQAVHSTSLMSSQAQHSTGNSLWQAVGKLVATSPQQAAAPHTSRRAVRTTATGPAPPVVAPPASSATLSREPASPAPAPLRLQHRQFCARPWAWPESCVVGVTAADPRLLQPGTSGAAGRPSHMGQLVIGGGQRDGGPGGAYDEQDLQGMLASWPDSGDWTDSAMGLLKMCLPAQWSGSPVAQSCADAAVTQPPPCFTAEQVGRIRQQARLSALQLPLSSSSHAIVAPPAEQCSCPVVLVRRRLGGLPGWSLLLPSGWVQPFWTRLAFAGVRPAGQQEWRWVMSQSGVPCFPWDYPHTPAWHTTARHIAQVQADWALRRPAGRLRRPPCMLPYIPWQQLGRPAENTWHVTHTWSHASMGLRPSAAGQSQQHSSATALACTPPADRNASPSAPDSSQPDCTSLLQPAATCMLSSRQRIQAHLVQLKLAQHLPTHSQQQLGWVVVRILGRGRCLEGAQLCCAANDVEATLASSEPASGTRASCPPGSTDMLQVIGHVTTSSPRGTKPHYAQPSMPYPGGLGVVCLTSFLHVLCMKSHGQRTPDVRQPVKLMLRNPGCSVLHVARAMLLLPTM